MDRTLRATLLAGFIAFASIAGLGIFLGFGVQWPLITGAVVGVLAALLIWGAARRADSFAEVSPPARPGFPGPPDPPEGERSGSEDPEPRHDEPGHDESGHHEDDPSDEGR